MAKKDIGIWLRVSTADQSRGDSLEIHEERARGYAKSKGWNVKEIYRLAGVSGKDVYKSPEAQRMEDDIRSGHITGLIFSKISRLARSTRQLLEFSELFKKFNADLISIYENIDTSNAQGNLYFTLLSAFSQFEREEIASRVKQSIEQRAKMGKKLGGQAQYGFKWKGDELVLHEEEAPIRKLMYELFLEEGTYRKTAIAKILNERGYRTRTNTKFNRSTIKRWLRDPISKGLRRANYSQINPITGGVEKKPQSEWYFHECPKIVSEEMWQKVNDILDEQDSNRKPILNRKVHIFTNYIFCHCGKRMNVRSRLTHYKCVSKECNNKIRREDLEEAFKSRLLEFLDNEKELKTYFKQSFKNIEKYKTQVEVLKKKLEEVKVELKSIIKLHSLNKITTEAFDEYHKEPYEQSKQLENEIIKLEVIILSNTAMNNSTSYMIKESKGIYTKWDKYEREKKREIIETILEKIVIGEEEIDFKLKRLSPKSYFSNSGKIGDETPTNNFTTNVFR